MGECTLERKNISINKKTKDVNLLNRERLNENDEIYLQVKNISAYRSDKKYKIIQMDEKFYRRGKRT